MLALIDRRWFAGSTRLYWRTAEGAAEWRPLPLRPTLPTCPPPSPTFTALIQRDNAKYFASRRPRARRRPPRKKGKYHRAPRLTPCHLFSIVRRAIDQICFPKPATEAQKLAATKIPSPQVQPTPYTLETVDVLRDVKLDAYSVAV